MSKERLQTPRLASLLITCPTIQRYSFPVFVCASHFLREGKGKNGMSMPLLKLLHRLTDRSIRPTDPIYPTRSGLTLAHIDDGEAVLVVQPGALQRIVGLWVESQRATYM